jgi:hypothetical protein
MTTARLVAIVVTGSFILSALPGVAQASEPTKILPEPTEASPIKGVGKAGLITFETASGERFTCESATSSGEFTGPNIGHGEARVIGCKAKLSIGTVNCNSPGDKTGEITLKDEIHYWLGLSGGKALIAVTVALITTPLKIECTALVSIEKRGCTAGQVPPGSLNKKIASLTGSLHQSKGKQEITEILPPESTKEIRCVSEISQNGGAFEEIGQEGEGTVEKFERGGKLIEVELMN